MIIPFLIIYIVLVQLLREITHENVVKLVNVHINHADMSLYLAFDYAQHDLYVSSWAMLLLLLALIVTSLSFYNFYYRQ